MCPVIVIRPEQQVKRLWKTAAYSIGTVRSTEPGLRNKPNPKRLPRFGFLQTSARQFSSTSWTAATSLLFFFLSSFRPFLFFFYSFYFIFINLLLPFPPPLSLFAFHSASLDLGVVQIQNNLNWASAVFLFS